jgi:hypothetical protein
MTLEITIPKLEAIRDEALRVYTEATKHTTIVNGFTANDAWQNYVRTLRDLAQAKKELGL